MNNKLIAHLSDPVKAKLIMEIHEQERATTGQLASVFSQIPQATLYRHMKKMLSDGIIKIVDEVPVRGTVEKVYALGFDFNENNKTIMETNDGEAYFQMAALYMLGILGEFKEYAEQESVDLSGDGTGFSHVPVYATTDELVEALEQIREVLQPLMSNSYEEGRKLRNLCIITTPPKN